MYEFTYDGVTTKVTDKFYKELFRFFDPKRLVKSESFGDFYVETKQSKDTVLSFCDHLCDNRPTDSRCPFAVFNDDKKGSGKVRKGCRFEWEYPCLYFLHVSALGNRNDKLEDMGLTYASFEWGYPLKKAQATFSRVRQWLEKNFEKV